MIQPYVKLRDFCHFITAVNNAAWHEKGPKYFYVNKLNV